MFFFENSGGSTTSRVEKKGNFPVIRIPFFRKKNNHARQSKIRKRKIQVRPLISSFVEVPINLHLHGTPCIKDSEDLGLSHFKPASTVSRERIAFRSPGFVLCAVFYLLNCEGFAMWMSFLLGGLVFAIHHLFLGGLKMMVSSSRFFCDV